MHETISVEARVLGKRKALTPPWHVALPPHCLRETTANTSAFLLRDLLSYIVREEVQAFLLRQEERRILRVLSSQEIAEAAHKGKITLGGEQERASTVIDEDVAVKVALQGFEDGLYLVFVDGQQQYNLDDPVQLQPASKLLFLRLVALVGG